MTDRPLIPVILCGGSGTRLWPLSRASYPKQYWSLCGNENESLLQQTHKRLEGLPELEQPLLICHEEHRFIVAEQMREINIEPKEIILEPVGRNTAAAIAVAAIKATESGEDPQLLVLSADHEIRNVEEFQKSIAAGRIEAQKGKLITFGIIPTCAETGYGYIQAKEPIDHSNPKAVKINKFFEKPTQEKAEEFIANPCFSWNSGMFLFQASTILKELEKLAPKILKSCKSALQGELSDLDFLRLEKKAFSECPNLSIDIAVMEKTNLGTVLPLNAGWNDVGNWHSLWETASKDSNGNFSKGKVIIKRSKNCYFRSEHRLIVGLGVEDLILIETDDAVLVTNQKDAQSVKDIVNELEHKKLSESKAHRKIYRPWGHYTSIVEGKRWQVKRIEVKPGEFLSLQMHHHRAEHWVIVKGTALIERDGKEELLGENQSTYIPLGCKHRLGNPGKMPLELIEIQSGAYIGEDDILRLEDRYGRVNKNK
ncbi:mannose-1-phosphate guanylyltransferase/mannose-6-phosphate isomerase [Prochlorococcus marinus]|uniref:mannose-1-phosphate guanylyltransferase n=1 Tax=Prochlorococcus marinus (strain MIT 9211) TaxID=93059 RepID=A9BD48_PROM4|nr:mannose-1-phosphate guanylyltransferase/mannose-6-phosphate isomerase [Prochlorococcus marinus]ABX09661.1 Mannose-1-phosphate guanylyltransferase [Prochlorococcus marinus str. MIT 9211]